MSPDAKQRGRDPDPVMEASKESFPASDPPAFMASSTPGPDPMLGRRVTRALYVTVETRPGRELEIENFLTGGGPLVELESGTSSWFAIKLGPTSYGIFAAFPDDASRQAHLEGKVLKLLLGGAEDVLASPPVIERIDVLAAKV